ncbi:hypothetical protein EYF80_012777 [Liparis tanakae]|uniref:Uncharacterized protein n=1 Tax=Liparis tanakae TaxID=230148 RepID=A0A4Z2IGT6_9TELE|nr:hypothetical protein EYF80_012777 [Liparis tanakae]
MAAGALTCAVGPPERSSAGVGWPRDSGGGRLQATSPQETKIKRNKRELVTRFKFPEVATWLRVPTRHPAALQTAGPAFAPGLTNTRH